VLLFLSLLYSLYAVAEPMTQSPILLRFGIGEGLPEHVPDTIPELKRAFEIAGYHLELVPLPAARSLISAASGALDGDFLHSLEAARAYPTLMPVKETLLQAQVWVWVRERDECPSSPAQLKGLIAADVLGYSFAGRIDAARDSKTVQASSVLAAMRVLHAGRADYLFFDKDAMQSYQNRVSFKLKTCFSEPLLSIDYYSFLHRRHGDKIPAIEAGIRQARAELAEP
jgi:hypothetical protein